jgi:hypothetical protein
MNIPVIQAIGRHFSALADVGVGTDIADSAEIDMLRFAGGAVRIPAASGLTTLTLHAACWPGGTYAPLHDKDGNAVTMTVAAGRVQAFPDAVYNVGAIKLVGNVVGTVDVVLKG